MQDAAGLGQVFCGDIAADTEMAECLVLEEAHVDVHMWQVINGSSH